MLLLDMEWYDTKISKFKLKVCYYLIGSTSILKFLCINTLNMLFLH